MDYLKSANSQQLEAIKCQDGPVMIIAGAGSGKTRVLTYRIATTIKNGVDAFKILALTFTNKASREMRGRVEKIAGSEARNIWMGTFHSVFARILRYEASAINYPSNFTIYDTDDTKSLMKSIIKEMNLNNQIYKPNLVLNRISLAKNNIISPSEYQKNDEIQSNDYSTGKPKIGMLYEEYQRRCRKSNAMDFDDLLFNTFILLRDFPDILYKYQNKFKYLLVDEFQDTNFVQYAIIKKLAAKNENICVVGDDAQSIYAFRGADIQNILSFQKDYPDCNTFKLEQNYRSTQVIVEAASNLIQKNQNQLPKELWTENDKGNKINVYKALTDNEEGRLIANSIFEEQMQNQQNNMDFAILYRTNAQSRAFEEALRKRNIKYKIYGGVSFYQRKEIKDLLGYLRLTVNHNDEEALKRVINFPARGIGKTSIEKLIVYSNDENKGTWEIVENITNYNLTPRAQAAISSFATMIKSFEVLMTTHNAYELASHIAQSSGILKDLYSDKTIEGISRYENIQELLNGIKEFTDETVSLDGQEEENKDVSLSAFLQEVSLLTSQDNNQEDFDHVSLMTIHMAKGLEFPNVYIVGLEEELFPSQMSMGSREDLEEERRLFYVAMTRAKQKLTLSYAENRYRWGTLNSCEPSRFISEIDPIYLEQIQSTPQFETGGWGYNKLTGNNNNSFQHFQKKKTSNTKPRNSNIVNQQLKNLKKVKDIVSNKPAVQIFDADDPSGLKTGMQVEHQKFGKGKVISLDGKADSQKATVFFQGFGQKSLLLKYAKLKII